jgi:hypothetical protein
LDAGYENIRVLTQDEDPDQPGDQAPDEARLGFVVIYLNGVEYERHAT